MSRTVRVNGEDQAFAGACVIDLLHALGVDPTRRGVAVAVNGTVVPRARWTDAVVAGGDNIEIVRPLSGG
ncbi:MAG: sulfur carrier protein ThiS [Proteobacteria bacterium]|nr:sulfur carrier protein ThiS [Pseudomonadota bacterium]